MQFLQKTISTICLGVCLLTVSANAQTNSSAPRMSVDDLPQSLNIIKRGSASTAIQRLAGIMLLIDPEGNVTTETLVIYESILLARARASALQHLAELDLDFDGTLTQAERRAVLSRMDSRNKVAVVMALSGADTDADGVISSGEMWRAAGNVTLSERRSQNDLRMARDLMILDFDGDGRLTLSEMQDSVQAIVGQ